MKHYLNEAHKQYSEKCLKALKEMSKHPLSREEMEAQCDMIVDAHFLSKKIQIPNRYHRNLYLEQTADDMYLYELKGNYKGLALVYNEEKKTYHGLYLWNERLLDAPNYFQSFVVKAITCEPEGKRIFVRLAVFLY